MRVRSAAVLLAVLGAAAEAQDSTAGPKTAALAGMVRDAFGRGLKDARLEVDRAELTTLSNDSGYFFLRGIPAGSNDFTVTKVGYSPVHFRIDLSPDTTLVVNIPMKSVQALDAVDVKAEQVSAKLMRAGYYERRNVGLGQFVGPEKIEKLQWSSLPSTLMRDVNFAQVRCSRGGIGNCKVRFDNCAPVIYVNGGKRTGELDEVVDMSEIYSLEVYRKYVPAEFMPAGCAIVVWTWNYADVPRPKKMP